MSTAYATRGSEPVADGEADQGRPDRQPHRDQGTEREQQHDDRDEESDRLADAGGRLLEGEVQVAAGLDLQLGRRAQVVEGRLEVGQVLRVEVLGLGVLHPDQGDLALGRHGGAEACRGSAARGVLHRGATSACSAGVSSDRSRAGRGVSDDVGAEPHLAGVRPLQQPVAAWESSPGASNGSSRSSPKAVDAARTRMAIDDPGTDHGPGTAGGEAAQAGECE